MNQAAQKCNTIFMQQFAENDTKITAW